MIQTKASMAVERQRRREGHEIMLYGVCSEFLSMSKTFPEKDFRGQGWCCTNSVHICLPL